MSNKEKNRQFKNACRKLGITDKNLENRFHRYLDSPPYKGVSDDYSFDQLLKVGKEFLEYTGFPKKKRVKSNKD